MLFSLPHWLAADATGTSGPLAINALLFDSVLVRKWHFLNHKRHSLESGRGAVFSLKLMAYNLRAYHTCIHPSMHVNSITITRTHVCNTVSDTVPALT